MSRFDELLARLDREGVEYILVGGMAGAAHGAARVTYDLDLVYGRAPENLERLARALAETHAYPRGAPPGLPFRLDAPTLQRGLNFTLKTDLGDLDLLGEITGGGGYEDLRGDSVELEILGHRCLCLGLAKLIEVKRAAGRPRDFEALAELEALAEELGERST